MGGASGILWEVNRTHTRWREPHPCHRASSPSSTDCAKTSPRDCPAAIEEACRQADHRWRNGVLDPATTIYLFLLQVLHGNTACQHVVHFGGWTFTDSTYCQARKRLPLAVYVWLLEGTAAAMRTASEGAAGSAIGSGSSTAPASRCPTSRSCGGTSVSPAVNARAVASRWRSGWPSSTSPPSAGRRTTLSGTSSGGNQTGRFKCSERSDLCPAPFSPARMDSFRSSSGPPVADIDDGLGDFLHRRWSAQTDDHRVQLGQAAEQVPSTSQCEVMQGLFQSKAADSRGAQPLGARPVTRFGVSRLIPGCPGAPSMPRDGGRRVGLRQERHDCSECHCEPVIFPL